MAKKPVVINKGAVTSTQNGIYQPPPRQGMGGVGVVAWVGAAIGMVLLLVMLFFNHQKIEKINESYTTRASLVLARSQDADGKLTAQEALLKQEIKAAQTQIEGTTRGVKLQEDNLERLTAQLARQERAREKAEKASDNGADLKRLKAEKARLEESKLALKGQIAKALIQRKTPTKKPRKPSLRDMLARRDPSPRSSPSPSRDSSNSKDKINVRNLDMAFISKKKTKSDSYGGRQEYLDMSAKVINRDSVNEFNGIRLEVYAFGEMVGRRDDYVLLKKYDEKVDVPKRETKTIALGQARIWYYKDGSYNYGYKYKGYVIFASDQDGNLLKVKTNKASLTKLHDKLRLLREGYRFDKNGNSQGRTSRSGF